jgi:aspartyl/asparaginyl-tRNA synthetase
MTSRRIIDLLRHGEPGDAVTLSGWVRTKRELKGFAFLEVNDGSSLQGLQVVMASTLADYEDLLRSLTTGASITVEGVLVASQGKNQRVELQAQTVKVWGTADAETYPLQKKRSPICDRAPTPWEPCSGFAMPAQRQSMTFSNPGDLCGCIRPSSPQGTVRELESSLLSQT